MTHGPITCHAGLARLIAECPPGYSLPRPFYVEPFIYAAEIARIWQRGWLFAGYACQLRSPGDYLTLCVADDPVLLVRDDAGNIRAMHNVCRHRGMVLCDEPAGRVGRIVCPYHQWTYSRDGSLVSCRGMQPELDKAELGLIPLHVQELAGLVFISLAAEPPDFEPARQLIEPMALPQGLERAKVAAVRDYSIAANWKLVWDNNRECYHCNVNHPQYIKANYDHYNADDVTDRIQQAIADATAKHEQKWAERGLSATHRQSGMATFPDPDNNGWYSCNRTILVDGWVSESLDGRQIAPLMGSYTDADVGTLRIRTVPNFWNHSSCDHAVSTRLVPAGPDCTVAQVTWLVHEDAEEGRDYQLADLLPFWQLTSEQDWALCERAQHGVKSSGYRPGPLSPFKEYNVAAFCRWYLQELLAGE